MERICKFANFAKFSYENFEDYSNLHFVNDELLEFYIYKKGDILWLVFRGTDSFTDVKTDLFFIKKRYKYKKIRIHSGFLNAYLKHKSFIHSFIDDSILNVKISGHSYGGAIATLCSIDLAIAFPKKYIETITFGCPRVGNFAFSKSYKKHLPNTVCVINGNDPVPRIPPRFLGFFDVGNHYYIGNYHIPLFFRFNDHKMDSYLSNLDCINLSTTRSLSNFLNILKSEYKAK